ncbi:MAG TPA: PfkB family carbohydrate kinase [Solirubrobacteraceae bacterium]|nr:PfkB family carbohydrate kinase [Solirubrobacteraceae bacterium]
MRTLCLGEALVDMICVRRVGSLAEADAFVPHFGGATANVTVAAARAAAGPEPVTALAGGTGDDAFGPWLHDRLADAGVDLRWFQLMRGQHTPVAFVAIDAAGDATYQIYGEAISLALEAVADRLPDAVEACEGLFFGSNTLVGERERALTRAARDQALAQGKPVLFDPNLRLHRWPTVARAAAEANACVEGAALVRCNRDEAEILTGEADPDAAAGALLAAGAQSVVVSLGAEGAILRGGARADTPGVPAEVVSTVGAGDCLTGVLVAALTESGYHPEALARALPAAVAAAARTCEQWGAV